MLPPLQYSALGFETFADEVLRPALITNREPLRVAIGQGRKGRFRPAQIGHRWGPAWSTAWFRLGGRVPLTMRGRDVVLRFSSGTEATLWIADVPVQGFDPYRDEALVLRKARGGERIDLLIEAACNLPLGVSTFWWDHPELHARWREAAPGRLEAAELVVIDHEVRRFLRTWDTLRKALLALPADSARAVAIKDGMRRVVASFAAGDVAGCVREVWPALELLVRGMGETTRTMCVAVAHAHIDTAWLWPIAETRRKCIRTFANVLRLMEEFPSFRFVCSQAQQYAWVEEDAPQLFKQIAKRVQEGRWETAGAMWVEPDCTCPSGESFIRQIIHGTRWWNEKFGAAARQSFMYLPDTFGFPACLPQIARLAGLETFITNKLSWSESNKFPRATFRWRGLDGSEVFGHLTPGNNYNSALEPSDLIAGERNMLSLDGHSFASTMIPLWLQPFGYGDGGGGPTADQVARAETMRAFEGLPRVTWDRVDRFCANLHDMRSMLAVEGRDIAAWDGELYLELHRGTYTSQAWLKRQNRLAESLLRDVEALACSIEDASGRRLDEVRERIDPLWKLVLLNQFHDILPGSSIAPVYDDARRDHLRVAEEAGALRDELERELAERVGGGGARDAVLVRNPASSVRSGVVEIDRRLVAVDFVPALGYCLCDPIARRDDPVQIQRERGGVVINNGILRVAIDGAGRIGELQRWEPGNCRSGNARDGAGRMLPLNQLVLYVDRPRRWEAWDVDRDYADRATIVEGGADVRVVREHRLRCEVRVRRRLGARSELFQTYRLDASSRRLDIRTEVDWQEERTLLRALFPCDVRATRATFGTQFGFVERPTHRNTSWDEARFEVPGHSWMDLSEPGLGVAILDDGKYGRSAHENVLGLSLLRSPNFPDAGADRGEHVFTYSIMLHDGDWRAANVDGEAEALREPLRAVRLKRRRRTTKPLPSADHPFALGCADQCRVEVAAWKPADNGRGRVLRLVETRGGRGGVALHWSVVGRRVEAVDVFERALKRGDARAPITFEHDRRQAQTRFVIKPFQIVTLRVTER